jgi:alpha-beta hydrolase superfamily lysophospholipase
MRAIAFLLGWLYILLPICVLTAGGWLRWRRRATPAWRPVLATGVSALLVAFAINYAYARAAGADRLWGQVLLSTWVTAGVMVLLKGFDAGLKRLASTISDRSAARLGKRGADAAGLTTRCVLLFAIGLPYVMGVAMVYRPKVRGPDPMEQLRLRFEDVRFGGGHGDPTLAGWWIEPAPISRSMGEPPAGWGQNTVLLCHGLGGSKSNALPMADHLLRAGYNILAIDFRAHGGSGGQVTTFGADERRDVLAAVAWLRNNRPNKAREIFGVGASMGAAALIAAAADDSAEGRAIDAVAVYGTYDDLGALSRTACDSQFPRPLNWLGRWVAVPVASAHCGHNLHSFVPAAAIGRISPRPVLVIHGRADEIIAFEHGRRLFESAGEPKQALWLEGDHNSVLMDADAARAVRAFFDDAQDSGR